MLVVGLWIEMFEAALEDWKDGDRFPLIAFLVIVTMPIWGVALYWWATR